MSIPLPELACPRSRLIVEQSHLKHPQSSHLKVINEHPFNYMMSTIIPNCAESPDFNQEQNLKYYEASIQVSSLINNAFVEAFVKRGELQLISSQSRIDVEDVISLTPKGSLCLNLTPQSYQQLGLIGRPSQYCKNTKQKRYVVEIDLTASFFKPERKNYERTRQCFTNNHYQFYNVLFTWKPSDDAVAPISVMKYFQSLGYECKEIDLDVDSVIMDSITSCPIIDPKNVECDGVDAVHYTELWEWLGAVSCDVDISSKDEVTDSDVFISSYVSPEPHTKVDCIYKESVTGLITISDISTRLMQLREKAVSYGWCALIVHGFTDAPVTWKHKEHSYQYDGDNIYMFVVFADGTYWLYYGLGTYDNCP